MIFRVRCSASSRSGLFTTAAVFGLLLVAFPARAQTPRPAGAGTGAPAREVPPPPPPSDTSSPPGSMSVETPPPGGMSVETPPPPPVRGRTYHMHDGFYLRMSLGGGYIGGTVSQAGAPDITLSGGGGAFDLLIGGTPAPGVVIGGAILGNTAPNPSFAVDDQQQDVSAQLTFGLAGPFIDGFTDPKGGFHVGGMLGGAGLSLDDNSGGASSTTFSGYGAGMWVGYAAWIASDWSLGGMLRLTGARTVHAATETTPRLTASARAITILFTALYH